MSKAHLAAPLAQRLVALNVDKSPVWLETRFKKRFLLSRWILLTQDLPGGRLIILANPRSHVKIDLTPP